MKKAEVEILREYEGSFHELSASRQNGAASRYAHRCKWCGELLQKGQPTHFVHVRVKLFNRTLTQTHYRAWWLYHKACYDEFGGVKS